MIEIPDDAYPWSESSSKSSTGLPDYSKDEAASVISRLPGLMDSLTRSISSLESGGEAKVQGWLEGNSDAYTTGLNQVGNWLQEPINNLASRGLWDSTLARDAITNLGSSIADDYQSYFQDAASDANEMRLSLAQSVPTMWATALQGGLSALDTSKESSSFSDSYSEDKLARYTELLSLLI